MTAREPGPRAMFTAHNRTTAHILGVATLAFAAGVIIARPYLPPIAVWPLLIFWLALSGTCIYSYWRNIDEVARDGQKTAWLWGGCLGMIVATIAMTIPATFPFIDAIIAWVDTSPGVVNASFVTGVFWVIAAQFIGFTAYWIFWWIAKR